MLNSKSLGVTRPRLAGLLSGLLLLAGCGGGSGGGSDGPLQVNPGNAALQAVNYGRLVDVFGLQEIGGELTRVLFRTDVLVGLNIQDQRLTGDNRPDNEILYDFIEANPENLQPRVFIPRMIGTDEFADAFDALDDEARLVLPARFGQQQNGDAPFTVVPRNAAIRLTFTASLEVSEDFFLDRNSDGAIVGVKNTEAVQLLRIVGDPNDDVLGRRLRRHPDSGRVLQGRSGAQLEPESADPGSCAARRRRPAAADPKQRFRECPRHRISLVPTSASRSRSMVRYRSRRSVRDAVGDLMGFNNSNRMSVIRDMRIR